MIETGGVVSGALRLLCSSDVPLRANRKLFCYRIRQLLASGYDSNRRGKIVQEVRGCNQLLVLRLLAAIHSPETADVSRTIAEVGPTNLRQQYKLELLGRQQVEECYHMRASEQRSSCIGSIECFGGGSLNNNHRWVYTHMQFDQESAYVENSTLWLPATFGL